MSALGAVEGDFVMENGGVFLMERGVLFEPEDLDQQRGVLKTLGAVDGAHFTVENDEVSFVLSKAPLMLMPASLFKEMVNFLKIGLEPLLDVI